MKTGGPVYIKTVRKIKVARLANNAAYMLQMALKQEKAATKA